MQYFLIVLVLVLAGVGALFVLGQSDLLLAFALFLFNVVMTFGIKGLIGIYSPAKSDTFDCVPTPQEA